MKKNKLHAFILILLSGVFFSGLKAQDSAVTASRISISSPNAAALGKYGDIPVSYHTGLPQINIPIYRVVAGNLELPISISYHASGLKVEEQASWVGAGWTLNAGGAITRTIRGAPDDRGYNNGFVTNGYYSDSGYYAYSFHPDGSIPPAAMTNGTGPDDMQFVVGKKDGEPDMFTFNFGTHSGKFYFNDDQSAAIVPSQDFRIQTDFALGPGFQGFIITTNDGVKYYFGKTGNNGAVTPVEVTYTTTTQNTYGLDNRAASSWFLNKIISADGIDSILFNYQQENYSYYSIATFPIFYRGINSTMGGWNNYAYEYDLTKTFTQGVRLSSITFPNGTITLTPSSAVRTDLAGFADQTMNDANNTDAKALSTIQISNGGSLCKTFTFYYNYFFDNVNGLNGGLFNASYPALQNIHSDKYRLRLDSLRESNCDSTMRIPAYTFKYFSELVPRKLTFALDHWGFYNGASGNSTLLTSDTMYTPTTFYAFPGANREAAWPAMRGGTLQKISYPTGGYDSLEFEPHSVYTNFNTTSPSAPAYYQSGYTGISSDPTTYDNVTLTSNLYNITIFDTDNHIAGSVASLQVKQGTNLIWNSGTVNPGETKTFNVFFPPGTYSLVLHKESPTTGFGMQVTFIEMVGKTITGNAMVGGLRIKSIKSFDAITSQTNTSAFTYTYSITDPGGNSSGILYSRPTYMQIIRNDLLGTIWGGTAGGLQNGCANPSGSFFDYYRSPSSIRPMATVQGNHIGYNEVYVSSTKNGYSVYRYYGSNVWDNITTDVCTRNLTQTLSCDPNIPNYPAPPAPFEYMRGEMKYEGHFNQDGKLIKDVYYYPAYAQNPIPTPGFITFECPDIASYTTYTLYGYHKVQDKRIETIYSTTSGSIANTTTTYYGSNFHVQPTRNVSITSNGDSLITNTKYAFDFRNTSCDAVPDSLSYYLNRIHQDSITFANYLATCTPQTGIPGWTNCRYIYLANFRYNMMNDRLKYMRYLKRYYTYPTGIFYSCYATARNSADNELKPVYLLQDEFRNAPIEVTNWKNSNFLHAYYNKFDPSLSPTGVAYPGKTQSVSIQASTTTFTNASISGNTITKDSRYLDESLFQFRNGNLEQATSHDGITYSYVYDYLGKYQIAKIVNSTVDQTAFTSFESDGKGGWTFTGASAPDGNAMTGTKSYPLANGAVSKSSLSTSKSFIVSYWSKSTSATVNGATATSTIARNGWNYFEHKLAAGISTVTVSGAVTIDELRLYPSDAQMITYTYSPLLGMTSDCDLNNRVNYYFYDILGRLRWIKDQDGNIIKTLQYHYANQTTAQ